VGVQSLLSELGAKLQSIQIATSGRSSLADGGSRQSSLNPSVAGELSSCSVLQCCGMPRTSPCPY
jgi:hypothetical protein